MEQPQSVTCRQSGDRDVAADERRKFDRKWPSILNVMLEYQQAWILGARDVDRDWDGYLARLRRLGLDGVLEAMQTAYDRQYVR